MMQAIIYEFNQKFIFWKKKTLHNVWDHLEI